MTLTLRMTKRTRQSIALEWNHLEPGHDEARTMYLLEREDYRIRLWVPIYSGFTNAIVVDNLRAETCFKFRIQAFSKNDTAKKKLAQEEIYADTLDDFMSVTTFHRAIQYGDLNDIRKFVRERRQLIDIYGTWGETALIKAARLGKVDILDYLLKSGADVDKASASNNRTALMVAIIHGHLDVVEMLNGRGCDWCVRDRTGCQAVHFISGLKDTHSELIEYVLSQESIDVNSQDWKGATVLLEAISLRSSLFLLKRILDAGANPNIKSSAGLTPLMTAILCRYNPAAMLLLTCGSTIDDVIRDNVSALTLAEATNSQDIVEELTLRMKNPPPPTIVLHNPPPD